MKVNIFQVPVSDAPSLLEKLKNSGLTVRSQSYVDGWRASFLFSNSPDPTPIGWLEPFIPFLATSSVDEDPATSRRKYENLAYYAAYVFDNPEDCFVLTYGKTHFYVRKYCNEEFGVEVAKRIITEDETKQTSTRRYGGKRTKEIRNFARNARLNIDSGESVDYIKAQIDDSHQDAFGAEGKFGASLQINPPCEIEDLPKLFVAIRDQLAAPARFNLPRTAVVTSEAEIDEYDNHLINAITHDEPHADFIHAGYELSGVDFIFSGFEKYSLRYGRSKPEDLQGDELTMTNLRDFISTHNLSGSQILDIKVKVQRESAGSFTKPLKESLDYIIDGRNVTLSGGKWLKFNDDYVDQLNESVDAIRILPTEVDFTSIRTGETAFNASQAVREHGYELADKDFSKIRTSASAVIEAWDLKKDGCVYALKFGDPKGLGYVCDQAMNVLEIIRNNANARRLDPDWTGYCLWLGFVDRSLPAKLSEIKSIILRQKIDHWRHACINLGIEPLLKFSLRTRA